MRYYVKVNFLNFSEHSVLDTGAYINCIGSDLATHDFSSFPNYNICKWFIKIADGKAQTVLGWLDVDMSNKDKTCAIKLFIISSISQSLINGVDF